MLITIVAGGTGGHFYPGLAVAQQLLKSQYTVEFLVGHRDRVIPILERENIPYTTISSAGLKRSLHPKNIVTLFKFCNGILESRQYLKSRKPKALLVMGGYLSVPPAWAAKTLRIPVLLHEQNAIPGLANKLVSWVATTIAVSFPQTKSQFKGNVVVTGNPVRESFSHLPSKDKAMQHWSLDENKKTFLVFGGSQGAHCINTLVLEALKKLREAKHEFQVLHFTGQADERFISKHYEVYEVPHYVSAYCHEMEMAYAAADFVVCRAGASTIFELLATKKPSLLIPYPHATANHQTINAQFLSHMGVAQLFNEKDLSGPKLAEILTKYLKDPTIQTEIQNKFVEANVNVLNASKAIAELLTR